MRNHLHLFGRLVVAQTKMRTSNRFELFLAVLGIVSASLVTAATLSLLASRSDGVAGWGSRELVFMQGFMLMAYSLQSGFFVATWNFESWLKDGSFLRFYVRPLHPIVQLAMEEFHPQGIVVFAMGLSLCVYGVPDKSAFASVSFLSSFVAMAILAALTYLAINLIIVANSFWSSEGLPLILSLGRINDMARYPLEIFPSAIRIAFQTLPLGCLAYWPARALLRGESRILVIGWMCVTAAVCLFLLDRVWKSGMNRYEGAGG